VNSSNPTIISSRISRLVLRIVQIAVLLALWPLAAAGQAAPPAPVTTSSPPAAQAAAAAPAPPKSGFDELLAAVVGGKPILDVVFRWEYAKQDQLEHSHGATARTRLGYQTGAYKGFTGLAEMVNTVSPKPGAYFDTVETNTQEQTFVADPERTDVNRAWIGFAKPEWAGLAIKAGRERFNLDDERWIGSVGWRQNEQTFDAAQLQTNLGVEKLLVQYIGTWEVNRIWGDQGPAIREDFNPRAHFLNGAYVFGPALTAVGFAYLVDPDQDVFRSFGSQTYGTRFVGVVPISERLTLPYSASYAYQEDWGNNPVSYGAHYGWLEAGLGVTGIGTFSAGYEHLGSDTDAVVVTPFATAHKFNGFADAFLNNGGNRGLRNAFASFAPALPWKGVSLKLFFHQFWDDQGGDDLGQEYDLVTSYALNQYISFLWKMAYYDGGHKPAFSKSTRSTLQMTFKF
jgi:Alginate export